MSFATQSPYLRRLPYSRPTGGDTRPRIVREVRFTERDSGGRPPSRQSEVWTTRVPCVRQDGLYLRVRVHILGGTVGVDTPGSWGPSGRRLDLWVKHRFSPWYRPQYPEGHRTTVEEVHVRGLPFRTPSHTGPTSRTETPDVKLKGSCSTSRDQDRRGVGRLADSGGLRIGHSAPTGPPSDPQVEFDVFRFTPAGTERDCDSRLLAGEPKGGPRTWTFFTVGLCPY